MPDERKMALHVTVKDLRTGEVQTCDVPEGDYFMLVTSPAYVAHHQVYANGTQVITVKGRTQP